MKSTGLLSEGMVLKIRHVMYRQPRPTQITMAKVLTTVLLRLTHGSIAAASKPMINAGSNASQITHA